nr:unnamed protein product [Callosobruchus analis]
MNIRSARKNIDHLQILLKSTKTEYDVIVLSESWIIHDPSVLTICGYRLLYNQGDINQNDGVLVYVRDSLSFQYGVTYISEVKAIVITLKYTTTNIKITALYRPPSTCPNKFIDSLTQYLDQQRQNDCETHFIIGDMNINIQECNATTNSYLNMMSTYGFKSYINGFTRVQGQIKSCIDHIFIKDLQSRYEYKSFILENDLTDHYPIIVQAIPFTEGKVQIKNKILLFVDNKKLVTEIEKETWLDIYACDSAELATNFFISKIQNAIRKSTNRIKIAHENRKRTPWITEKIIKMVNQKNALYIQTKNNPTAESLEAYRKIKNEINKLIKDTKKNIIKLRFKKGAQILTQFGKLYTDSLKKEDKQRK